MSIRDKDSRRVSKPGEPFIAYVIPTRGEVFFPYGRTSVEITDPATTACLKAIWDNYGASKDARFLSVAMKPGADNPNDPTHAYDVGTIVQMYFPVQTRESGDGHSEFSFQAVGLGRGRITRILDADEFPYRAEIELLRDIPKIDLTEDNDFSRQYLEAFGALMVSCQRLIAHHVDPTDEPEQVFYKTLFMASQAQRSRDFHQMEAAVHSTWVNKEHEVEALGIIPLLKIFSWMSHERFTIMLQETLETNSPIQRLKKVGMIVEEEIIGREKEKGWTEYEAQKDVLMIGSGDEGKPAATWDSLQDLVARVRTNIGVVTSDVPLQAKPAIVAADASGRILLDAEMQSPLTIGVQKFFEENLIGQPRAVNRWIRTWGSVESGIVSPTKPLGSLILFGPSGVGKTHLLRLMAQLCFGSQKAMTRLDGGRMAERFQVSELIGASPNYIGYEDMPKLAQYAIDKHHYLARFAKIPGFQALQEELERLENEIKNASGGKPNRFFAQQAEQKRQQIEEKLGPYRYNPSDGYCSILLFDEIEKAHPTFFNVALSILDEAELAMSRPGQVTRFNHSVVGFSSNIGSSRIAEKLSGRGDLGFHSHTRQDTDDKRTDDDIYNIVMEEIERNKDIPSEFIGRVGDIIVFRPLRIESLFLIFDLELIIFQDELVQANIPITVVAEERLRKFIVHDSTDKAALGARLLKGKLRKYLRGSINSLCNTGQIASGDTVIVSLENHAEFERALAAKGLNRFKPKIQFYKLS
jgi:hypothetical protein